MYTDLIVALIALVISLPVVYLIGYSRGKIDEMIMNTKQSMFRW